jgi:hypothetical protein
MRFLVDECTGPNVASWLRDDGYEVFSVYEDARAMEDDDNGLKKKSVVDCFQIRAVSHNRFAEIIGEISNDEIDHIKRSITLILDIEPEHCEE